MDAILKSDYVKLDNLYAADKVSNTVKSWQGGHDYSYKEEADTPNEGSNNQKGEEPFFCCKKWSLKQRVIGFIACACLGVLFTIFSWITIFRGDTTTFAVLYTLSNLVFLISTFFLCGPMRQLRNMAKLSRLIATLVFLVAMVLTFVMAFATSIPGLTILFIFIQFFALAWYSITYIPFAQDAILRCFGCKR